MARDRRSREVPFGVGDLDRRAEVVAALEGWASVDITGLAAASRAPAWERF